MTSQKVCEKGVNVDYKTLQELEFDSILEMVRKKAFSAYGRAYFTTFKEVEDVQDTFDKVEDVLERIDEISDVFYNVEDVRKHLELAKTGRILDQKELHDFFELFKVSKRLSQLLSQSKLNELSMKLIPPEGFITMFEKTFTSDGKLKDNASAQLLKIRRKIKSLERQLNEKTKSLLFEGVNKGYVSEALVVQRHERYVLPVKASKRGMVKGIVHAQSSTLSTYYVEPEELIGLNDSLILARSQERVEISRILSSMTKFLMEKYNSLKSLTETLELFDALCARARYARENDCVIPKLRTDGKIKIVNGRNPLISPQKVVAINFEMDEKTKAVVISGPNTGGKTATLKTVGTFALMTLMGIPIPSGVGTEMTVFKSIFSDIGDDQSIKNELSTFSAKVKREDEICKQANEKTLVLIDEMGDGTEPTEGVAFAKSVLELLLRKNARVLVTTHLPELKTFALQDERVKNASVGFDLNTLTPTYKIHMDMPGKSHALEIIKKMKVSNELVEAFEKNRKGELSKVDLLIEKIQNMIQEYENKNEKLLEKERMLKAKEEKINEKIEVLKEKRIEELDEKLQSISRNITETSKEIEKAIHLLKRSRNTEELRQQNKRLIELKKKIKELTSVKSENDSHLEEIKVGSYVKIRGTNVKGTVIKINGEKKKAIVETETMQVEVELKNVELSLEAPLKESNKKEYFYETYENFSREIDLRGMTVEDALPIVEEFSDRVLKFRTIGYIIHGKGTGRLANGIWEFLRMKKVPFRIGKKEEGGTGVTVIGGE